MGRQMAHPELDFNGEFLMYTKQAGTLGYCAPERLREQCKYT
jgi:hypothetical protein